MSAKRATKAPTTPLAAIEQAIMRFPVLERRGAGHLIIEAPDSSLDDCCALSLLTEDAASAAENAVDAVLDAVDPEIAARLKALHLAFDDQWNEVECALRMVAFAVGYEYGHRIASEGGAR